MDDLISRQAAIDALCNDYCGGHQDCKYYPKCENLKSIQKLPSVERREVRHGRWEPYLNKGLIVKCSVCGSRYVEPWNYCPNCGSRMDGDTE